MAITSIIILTVLCTVVQQGGANCGLADIRGDSGHIKYAFGGINRSETCGWRLHPHDDRPNVTLVVSVLFLDHYQRREGSNLPVIIFPNGQVLPRNTETPNYGEFGRPICYKFVALGDAKCHSNMADRLCAAPAKEASQGGPMRMWTKAVNLTMSVSYVFVDCDDPPPVSTDDDEMRRFGFSFQLKEMFAQLTGTITTTQLPTPETTTVKPKKTNYLQNVMLEDLKALRRAYSTMVKATVILGIFVAVLMVNSVILYMYSKRQASRRSSTKQITTTKTDAVKASSIYENTTEDSGYTAASEQGDKVLGAPSTYPTCDDDSSLYCIADDYDVTECARPEMVDNVLYGGLAANGQQR